MIPQVITDDDDGFIRIPVLGYNIFCFVLWNEDETVEDFFINNHVDKDKYIYTKIHVSTEMIEDHQDTITIYVYEILCKKTDVKYFLICHEEFEDFSSLDGCVCVPYNRWNIYKFVSEYMMPFSGKDVLFC